MTYWIVPWNRSHYNLDAAISRFGGIDWHQWSNFKIGDIVFIYCTKPTGALVYEMDVIEVNLRLSQVLWDDETYYNKSIKWTKEQPKGFARFKLLRVLDNKDGALSHANLVDNGMTYSVQSPIKIKPELLKYILKNI